MISYVTWADNVPPEGLRVCKSQQQNINLLFLRDPGPPGNVSSKPGPGEAGCPYSYRGRGDSTREDKSPVAFLSHRQMFLQFWAFTTCSPLRVLVNFFLCLCWAQGPVYCPLGAIKSQGSGCEFWQLSTHFTQRSLTLLWFSILKSIPTLEVFFNFLRNSAIYFKGQFILYAAFSSTNLY